MRVARDPRKPPLEKAEQANIIKLVEVLGGSAYEIGRPRPSTDGYQGLRQTPGVPDLWIVLPIARGVDAVGLWWETKSETGERSEAQDTFALWSHRTKTPYGYGTCSDFILWLQQHERKVT